MRVTLLTYGSRGDVQPFVALGVALRQRGHQVRLAAPSRFGSFVQSYGLSFTPLAGDPVQLSEALVEEAGMSSLGAVRAMMAHVLPIAGEVMTGVRTACRDADAIVHSFLHLLSGHSMARELGVPDFSVQLFPLFAKTSAFPSLALPALPLGRRYNRLSHSLYNRFYWLISRLGFLLVGRHPAMPRELHWPFSQPDPTPLLFAFSPAVLPQADDWGPHVHLTGYWHLETNTTWQPPADLAAFLAQGPPPVCFTFGSMVRRDRERLLDAILAALAATGRRGLILTGWGLQGDGQLPANVLAIDEAPHEWLFPQTSLVVHHGGAGTTGAALRAGVPNLVLPHFGDQPFWGNRVHALGVGPPPIAVKSVSGEALARSILRVEADRPMGHRAAHLGQRLRGERGAEKAAEIIERIATVRAGSGRR